MNQSRCMSLLEVINLHKPEQGTNSVNDYHLSPTPLIATPRS